MANAERSVDPCERRHCSNLERIRIARRMSLRWAFDRGAAPPRGSVAPPSAEWRRRELVRVCAGPIVRRTPPRQARRRPSRSSRSPPPRRRGARYRCPARARHGCRGGRRSAPGEFRLGVQGLVERRRGRVDARSEDSRARVGAPQSWPFKSEPRDLRDRPAMVGHRHPGERGVLEGPKDLKATRLER